ncbi:MAG: glycoside hydrolase family 55 protein [Deltaproteobacteria bacterium]|nr:glycoside hydrolase family 55 protein [Deltaproteobacteria bacterium]
MSRRHGFFIVALCFTTIVCARASHAQYGSSFALPEDAPKANVRDFGAKGDGTTDDTAAIKTAIASTYAAWEAIYLPAGTYLVSDSIDVGRFLTIRGDGTGKTIIKLKNNASGYGDRNKPKFVLRAILAADVTSHNNTTHSVHFMHFTVDVGAGNPGAVAVDFMAHNGGGIEDVALKAPAGSGSMGISLLRDANGPSLFSRINISGFDTGIAIAGGVYGTVFEHVTLTGQKVVGIKNDQHPLTMRDLMSTNQVPAIHSEAPEYGMLVLLDSRLEGGATGSAAVEATGSYLIRDLRVQGYGFALKSGNTTVPGPTIDERTSSPIRVSGASKAATLRMPIKEPPESAWDAPSSWQSVRAFENLVKNGDWTPAIQAAIDAGKPTVYFPNNTHSPYPCKGDVHLRGAVRRLIGMEANLDQGRLIIDGTDAKAVYYIEQVRADGGFIHASPATVVLRRSLGGSVTTKPGAGDLFVDDWCCGNFVVDHSNVWARQLNEESLTTKLQVNGGRLWILGLKTEQFGTVGRFQNGAAVEILGGLIYPAQGKPTTPAYVNEDSFFTAFHREIGNGYATFDRETRNGKTTDVNPSFTQGTMFTSSEGWTGAVAPGTGGAGGSSNTAGAGGSSNTAGAGGNNAGRGGSGGNRSNGGRGGNDGGPPAGGVGGDVSNTAGTDGNPDDDVEAQSSNGCQIGSHAHSWATPFVALLLLCIRRRRLTRRS